MVSTTLTCTDEPEVDKEIEIDNTLIDTVDEEDKVENPAAASALDITTSISTKGDSGAWETLASGTDVILGNEVKLGCPRSRVKNLKSIISTYFLELGELIVNL